MSTILEEARRMGVKFLPVCIFRSRQMYRVEDGAVRIPLTQVAEIHLQRRSHRGLGPNLRGRREQRFCLAVSAQPGAAGHRTVGVAGSGRRL